MEPTQHSYYTVKSIADALELSRVTIFRYIKEGKLKAMRHGRIYLVKDSDYLYFHYKHIASQEHRDSVISSVREFRDSMRDSKERIIPHTTPHTLGTGETN